MRYIIIAILASAILYSTLVKGPVFYDPDNGSSGAPPTYQFPWDGPQDGGR